MSVKSIRYSQMHGNKTIVHFVGGIMTQDLLDNLDAIAWWVLENDITILWGDDYQEKYNKNHPVAALIQRVKAMAKEYNKPFNKPIRILQLGNHYKYLQDAVEAGVAEYFGDLQIDYELGADIFEEDAEVSAPYTDLTAIYDNGNKLIGYLDNSVKDETTIYTHQQQDRQRAYYNNADGLFVLPGGMGCKYEIVNAFLYRFTDDLPKHFPIYIIDDNGLISHAYRRLIESYANTDEQQQALLKHYYASASEFVKKELADDDVAGV